MFTEFGYRSVDYTGKEPWQSDQTMNLLNMKLRLMPHKLYLMNFWNEDWFAGGFIWKWFHAHDKVGGIEDNQFTPQNKPVEEVIKANYLAH